MRTYIILGIFSLGWISLSSQSLDRVSQSAQYGQFKHVSFELEWVIGESFASTRVADGVMLTQGFLQSDLEGLVNGGPDIQTEDWAMFPNPAQSITTLRIQSESQAEQIAIYSSLGALLKTVQVLGNRSIPIGIEEFQSGNYIVCVLNKNGEIIWSKSLIIAGR